MPRLTLQYLKFNQILFANLTIAGEFSNRIKKKKICWRIWNHFVRKNGYKTIWIFTLYLKFITIALGQDVPFKVKFWRSFKNSINIYTLLFFSIICPVVLSKIPSIFSLMFFSIICPSLPFRLDLNNDWKMDEFSVADPEYLSPNFVLVSFRTCPEQGPNP